MTGEVDTACSGQAEMQIPQSGPKHNDDLKVRANDSLSLKNFSEPVGQNLAHNVQAVQRVESI